MRQRKIWKGGIEKMAGIIYGIGVGPGDPMLMTLKAVNTIRECDLIGIPAKDADSCTAYRIALLAVPEMADKPVLPVPVPMTTDASKLDKAYCQGCTALTAELRQGRSIAFLNLGDPTVYGTYLELHERIKKAGFEAVLVSGVPSFCAVAAELSIALGSGNETIHILPGCYQPKETEAYGGTRILMKSGGKLSEVKHKLVELEEAGEITAYAVTNCGMKDQTVCRNIRTLDETSGYFTTIIVKEGTRHKKEA